MKFNLKNRPRLVVSDRIEQKMPAHEMVDELAGDLVNCMLWFEAFEKELREKLVYPANVKSVEVYDFIKKELLGE